ncbi:MAG: sugar ABC transporter permease [Clostridiales bacterium]|nr:sugar ABC transporter permease [Clostridiales bacterium]
MPNRSKGISPQAKGQRRLVWIVVGVMVVWYLVFMIFPLGYSFVGSFFDWNIANGTFKFNGLDNYRVIFTTPKFRASLVNGIVFSVVTTIARVGLAAMFAALIFFCGKRMQKFYRVVFFLPIVISFVAASYLWKWYFDGKNGLINHLIFMISGTRGPNWLKNGDYALTAVIIMTVWKDVGFAIIMYLAGLQQISSSIYEAAQIDGAGRLRMFRHIMLPLLGSASTFLLVTSLIGYIPAFDQFFIMTSGGPGTSTYVPGLYLYETAFKRYNFGQASATSFVMFAIVLVLSVINLKMRAKRSEKLL